VQPELTRQLDQAVAEVLAVMLNLACTFESLDQIRPPRIAITASVFFSGTLEGVCTLGFDHATSAELTANLIGIPPALISRDLCDDTAAELCNMIAGSWKSAQSRTHDGCHISCPAITSSEFHPPTNFRHTIARLYRFDGHHMSLTLSFN